MGRYIPDFAGTYRIFVLNTGTTTMRAGTYRAGNFGTGPGPCPVFRSNPVPGIPGFSNAPHFYKKKGKLKKKNYYFRHFLTYHFPKSARFRANPHPWP